MSMKKRKQQFREMLLATRLRRKGLKFPEPKIQVLIPMYEPLEVSKCGKWGKIIAEPKELIRIEQEVERAISKKKGWVRL